MSKASGWKRWKAGNPDYQKRSRYSTPEAVEAMLESPRSARSRVGQTFVEYEMFTYNDQAEPAIAADRVKLAAAQLTKEAQHAGAHREEHLANAAKYLESYDKTWHRVNNEKAAQAKAVLIAAEAGRVKLTEAQRDRLKTMERGEFLPKYGNRKAPTGGHKFSSDESRLEYEDRRREFVQNVAAYGWRSKRKQAMPVPETAQYSPPDIKVPPPPKREEIVFKVDNPWANLKKQEAPPPSKPTAPTSQPRKDDPWSMLNKKKPPA